jgi:hypothetical protein
MLFLSISFFVIGFVSKIDAPLLEWDHVVLKAAQNWSKGINSPWIFDHPPLYPMILTVPFLLFGATFQVARITNAFYILLTAWFIFKLSKYLSNRNSGLWAAVIYLLSPSVIQGSLSMDVADANLLPLGFVLFAWSCVFASNIPRSFLQKILVGLTIAFCFWAKVTASMALFVGILTYPFINPKKRDNDWLRIVVGCLIGGAVFIVTWISISFVFWGKESCMSILSAPWVALKSNLESSNFMMRLSSLGLNLLRIVFWFSPFFLILVFWQDWLLWKNRNKLNLSRIAFLGWISFLYFLVFLVVGGTNWGFPRYHMAILPIFIVLVSVSFQSLITNITKKEIITFISAVIFIFIIYVFLFDDLLLLLNLKFKEAILFGNFRSFAMKSLLQGGLFLAFPFSLLFLPRLFSSRSLRERIIFVLLMAMISSYFAVDFKQCRAPYSTFYQYGAEGKEELLSKAIEEINAGETILATAEFLYALKIEISPRIAWGIWRSNENLLEAVRQRPKAIIMGLTTHTLDQLRYVFKNSKMQDILNFEYKMYRIGSYFLWIRKG